MKYFVNILMHELLILNSIVSNLDMSGVSNENLDSYPCTSFIIHGRKDTMMFWIRDCNFWFYPSLLFQAPVFYNSIVQP
jgi:hypothetical protein